jgi:hypothetical protein
VNGEFTITIIVVVNGFIRDAIPFLLCHSFLTIPFQMQTPKLYTKMYPFFSELAMNEDDDMMFMQKPRL